MVAGKLYRGVTLDRDHRNVINFSSQADRDTFLGQFSATSFSSRSRIGGTSIDVELVSPVSQAGAFAEWNYISMDDQGPSDNGHRIVFAFIDAVEQRGPACFRLFYTIDVWQTYAQQWGAIPPFTGTKRTPKVVDGTVIRSYALQSAPLSIDVPFVGEKSISGPTNAFTKNRYIIFACVKMKVDGGGDVSVLKYVKSSQIIKKAFTTLKDAFEFWALLCSMPYIGISLVYNGARSAECWATFDVVSIMLIKENDITADFTPLLTSSTADGYHFAFTANKGQYAELQVLDQKFSVFEAEEVTKNFVTASSKTAPVNRTKYFGTYTSRIKIPGNAISWFGHYEIRITRFGVKIFYGVSYGTNSKPATMTDITTDFEIPAMTDKYVDYLVANREQLKASEMSRLTSLGLGLASSAVAIGAGVVSGNPLATVGGVLNASNTIAGTVQGYNAQAAALTDMKNQPWSGGGFGNGLLNIAGFQIWETAPGNLDEVDRKIETHGALFTSPVDDSMGVCSQVCFGTIGTNKFDYVQILDAAIVGPLPGNASNALAEILARGVRIWYGGTYFLNGYHR